MSQQHHPRRKRPNAARLAIVATALVLGLLLWARVIVIARMPRHAIADEEAVGSSSTTPAAEESHSGPR